MEKGRFAFDRYVVDIGRRRLLRNGKPVALHGKTFDLLVLLIGSEGNSLSREAIYDRLWPSGTVEDGSLSQNIYVLRRALDPEGDGRSFIETLPRYGYRFTRPVRHLDDERPPRSLALWRVAYASLMVVGLLAAVLVQPRLGNLPAGAREAYVLGVYHLNMRSETDLKYALQYFEQTTRRAPDNAVGYASVAAAYALLAQFDEDGSARQRSKIALAQKFRDKALALDPNNSQALAVSGLIENRFLDNREKAEQYLRAALSRDRNNAQAHLWLGEVLLSDGRSAESIAELQTAHLADPTSEVFARWLARAYTFAHRPRNAVPFALEALRIRPQDASAWLILAAAQEQRGKLVDAMKTLKAMELQLPSERQWVKTDEARLQLLIDRGVNRSREVAEMNSAVTKGQADLFEAALFYQAAHEQSRASHALQKLARFRWQYALDIHDPRFDPRMSS